MIKLNDSRILEALLASAVSTAEPVAAVSYNDKAAGFDGDTALVSLDGTTAVAICGAPAADAIRHIDYISIRNFDSAQVVLTVQITEGATTYKLIEATLEAGEVIGYTHSAGWYVNAADGSRKSGALQDLSAYLTIEDAEDGFQPLDTDLTAVAALTPSNDDVLQRKAGAWSNRTIAQLLVDLSSPGTTFQPLDSDLSAIASLSTTAYGRALLTLADAAALRVSAGLGTLATQDGTFSGTSSGTNSGDQNVFGTVAVSGQSNVVADGTADTLTFAAGSNVTITTNAGTDTVTIAAAGGSPGGSSGAIQGNTSGAFAAIPNWAYDTSTGEMTYSGSSNSNPLTLPQAGDYTGSNGVSLRFGSSSNGFIGFNNGIYVRSGGVTFGVMTLGFPIGQANFFSLNSKGVFGITNSSVPGDATVGLSINTTTAWEANNGCSVAEGGSLRDLKLRNLIWGSAYTVATLPSASTIGDGATLRVSDLTGASLGSAPSGSGSTKGLVTSNGSSYTVTQFG